MKLNLCLCGPRRVAAPPLLALDAGQASDPTGTSRIVARFTQDMDRRWRGMRDAMLAAATKFSDPRSTHGSDQVRAFQTWLDETMRQSVLGGTGVWMLKYLQSSESMAVSRGKRLVSDDTLDAQSRVQALLTMAGSELQGICDAVSQQATRAFASGLLIGRVDRRAVADVAIDVGRARGRLLAQFFTVRMFSAATLDTFRAAGITHVGTRAEARIGRLTTDAAKSKKAKKKLKALGEVDVLTAGDDNVCPICEDISEEGPYDIDYAETLIPAHPHCRCAFVPTSDHRFASVHDEDTYEPKYVVDDFDPNQDRDNNGRWSNGGMSASTAKSKPPSQINGIPFKEWTPPQDGDWNSVSGQNHDIDEPPLPELEDGQHLSSGIVVVEPDGRTWLTKPANGYGGYKHSFPKGTVEDGLNPQANAIKEVYEETGLKARIVGFIGDYVGDTSITRMYRGVRESGDPTQHGWESEAVVLAHPRDFKKFLNRSRDKKIAAASINDEFNPNQPRDKFGKWTETGAGTTGSTKADEFAQTLKTNGVAIDTFHDPKAGVYGVSTHYLNAPAFNKAAEMHGVSEHQIEEKGDTLTALFPPDKKIDTPAELNFSDLTKVSGKMGSNEGGVYKDKDGNQYYVKKPKSKDHVTNELIAAALYKLAGVNTLDYVPVKGGEHVATRLQPLEVNNVSGLNQEQRLQAQKDFAIHAWLANWDAVGTGGDNVGVVNGKVTTLDTGGSLAYRAQGGPKGAAFGNTVTEIQTLRDSSKNFDAAKLYGGMSNDDIMKSMERLEPLSEKDIRETVTSRGGSKELADKVVARWNDIGTQHGVLAAKSAAKPELAPTPAATVPDDKHPAYGLMKFVSGTSAERVMLRKHLTTMKPYSDDANTTKLKIIASFWKQHQALTKKGSPKAADIASKLSQYAIKYKIDNPLKPKKTAAPTPSQPKGLSKTTTPYDQQPKHEKKANELSEIMNNFGIPAIVTKSDNGDHVVVSLIHTPDNKIKQQEFYNTAKNLGYEKHLSTSSVMSTVMFSKSYFPDVLSHEKKALDFAEAVKKDGFDPVVEKKPDGSYTVTAKIDPSKNGQEDDFGIIAQEFGFEPEAGDVQYTDDQNSVFVTFKPPVEHKSKPLNISTATPAPKPAKPPAPDLSMMDDEELRHYMLDKVTKDGDKWVKSGQYAIDHSKKLQAMGVTASEIGYIRAFTGPYSGLNRQLRDGGMSEEVFYFKHIMNDALSKFPPYDGDTVWRKLNLSDPERTKLYAKPGTVVHWPAFSSTAKNPQVWSGNTQFVIHKPKTGRDVQGISVHTGEAEVIMPADTYVKVLKAPEYKKCEDGSTRWVIELEEVIPFGKKKVS